MGVKLAGSWGKLNLKYCPISAAVPAAAGLAVVAPGDPPNDPLGAAEGLSVADCEAATLEAARAVAGGIAAVAAGVAAGVVAAAAVAARVPAVAAWEAGVAVEVAAVAVGPAAGAAMAAGVAAVPDESIKGNPLLPPLRGAKDPSAVPTGAAPDVGGRVYRGCGTPGGSVRAAGAGESAAKLAPPDGGVLVTGVGAGFITALPPVTKAG